LSTNSTGEIAAIAERLSRSRLPIAVIRRRRKTVHLQTFNEGHAVATGIL